jgi:hypothetical protein
MTRRRGPSAPNTKTARTSFIATPEKARSFLLSDEGGLDEAQVELARQIRDLASDIRVLLSAYAQQVYRNRVQQKPAMPLEVKEFDLRFPAPLPVHQKILVELLLEDVVRLARALTDAQRSPAAMEEFQKRAEKKLYWTLDTLPHVLNHTRKLEAGIITAVAKTIELPILRERHLAALAVLPPGAIEPPQPEPRLVKSRTMGWRYALERQYEVRSVLEAVADLFRPDLRQELFGERKQDSALSEILKNFERLRVEGKFGKS